jgi:hypothetical protein
MALGRIRGTRIDLLDRTSVRDWLVDLPGATLQLALQRSKIELLQLARIAVFVEQQQHTVRRAGIGSAGFEHPAAELRQRTATGRE